MRVFLNKVIFGAVLLMSTPMVYGQDLPEPPPPPTPPPGLPIDGGILGLLFVSIFYGVYRIHQYTSKKNPV